MWGGSRAHSLSFHSYTSLAYVQCTKVKYEHTHQVTLFLPFHFTHCWFMIYHVWLKSTFPLYMYISKDFYILLVAIYIKYKLTISQRLQNKQSTFPKKSKSWCAWGLKKGHQCKFTITYKASLWGCTLNSGISKIPVYSISLNSNHASLSHSRENTMS